MMKKKKLFYILFSVVLFISFILGGFCGAYIYKNNINNEAVSNVNSFANNDDIKVSNKTNIILSTIYEKSGDCIKDKEVSGKQYSGENRKELEKSFEKDGYVVEKMTSSEVSMKRAVNRYAPNKYIVGIKDGYIAIFKTDKEGNEFIEDSSNDITKIRTANLKQGDIDLLQNGSKDFEFNTKDEAFSKLEDYI